jgi:Na+-translocating ferredoxin:NAD+ oxidoreductase subunit G
VSGDARTEGPAPLPGSEVRSFRLLATLGGAGALAGLLIVLAFEWTLPAIEANRAARLDRAVHEVLQGIERYDTLYLHRGMLVNRLPDGVDGRTLEKVYEGYDEPGQRVGFAIPAGEPGFQDVIGILFGFEAASRTTLGLTILDSRETPGLGDKIEEERWLVQFRDARTPLVHVKPGTARDAGEIDMITGATISARTVVTAINNAVERWTPALDAYLRGGGSP